MKDEVDEDDEDEPSDHGGVPHSANGGNQPRRKKPKKRKQSGDENEDSELKAPKPCYSILDEFLPLIRAQSKFRTRWDIVVIILSLWICFTLPVQIAFEPASLNMTYNDIINVSADVIYILDIFVNFRTTVFNELTNDEIFDTRQIA